MVDIQKVELRKLQLDDYHQLRESMEEAYQNWPSAVWSSKELTALINTFPDGQIAVTVNDIVVGCSLSIIVDYKKFSDNHTYKQITGDYSFDTHNDKGDVLYGLEVFIHPEYRGKRLGRRLYDYRKEFCEQLNLKAIIFGGRIPNYYKHQELKPGQYIEQVRMKEIHDPTLTFQISNDFHVLRVLKGYMPGDMESKEYAVLLQWNNIYYTEPEDLVPAHVDKSVIRLGLVQWQMRAYNAMDDLMEQSEFFVDAVSSYQCDFAVFPEFFNAPLMAKYNHLSESEAIRKLAEYTDEIRERFVQLAIQYNVNIIAGSMPKRQDDDHLYNIGYLCRRDGTFEEYEKIHVTPDEEKFWGITGGSRLKTFDTDCGKIGILICYDVEFPELARILALEGINILFVPFLTDTQNGYSRVRHCAQARAIENECYVAIAGSVGNLPKVHNMDIQFAQSMVFTPCDFSFPSDGIKAQATPNAEMMLVADVDTQLLNQLHNQGSVRNLKDRREDVYEIKFKK